MNKDTKFGIQSECRGVMGHNMGKAGWDPTETGRIKCLDFFICW